MEITLVSAFVLGEHLLEMTCHKFPQCTIIVWMPWIHRTIRHTTGCYIPLLSWRPSVTCLIVLGVFFSTFRLSLDELLAIPVNSRCITSRRESQLVRHTRLITLCIDAVTLTLSIDVILGYFEFLVSVALFRPLTRYFWRILLF